MAFRVIQMTKSGKYRVQKKEGFIFRRWEYLNQYQLTLDYNRDDDDATPVEFDTQAEATSFMERAYAGQKPPPPEFTIVSWIGEKE